MELIGLYMVACALLVAAGVSKAIRPSDTARALVAMVPFGLGATRKSVRAGSLFEAALGIVALVYPRTGSASLVALSYAGFAAVVVYARTRGGAISSCGCFGTPDTPATTGHVIVNVCLSLVAASVAVAGPTGSILSLLSRQPGHGLSLIVVSALCTWLTYLVVSALAGLQAARGSVAVSFRSDSDPTR